MEGQHRLILGQKMYELIERYKKLTFDKKPFVERVLDNVIQLAEKEIKK